MLKLITTLTLFLFGLLAKGQESETRPVTDFTRLEVKNATVVYTQSAKSSLKIESAYNDTSETIKTEVTDGVLRISGNDDQIRTIVYVTGNAAYFKLRSNAKVTLTNEISAQRLEVLLNSGSSLSGNLTANVQLELTANKGTAFKGVVNAGILTGSFNSDARVILCGKAKNVLLNAKDTSLVNARNLSADQLQINAKDHATLNLYAKNLIGIEVSDQAKITYNGAPAKITLSPGAVAYTRLMAR